VEREFRGKSAGLRTHVVVATACAALGALSLVGVGASDVADQTRIAGEVVSGIGFMGAGVIFAFGGRVQGLTTAAALFSAAAIGLCTGMGAYLLASALVLVTLLFLGPVDWLTDRVIGRRVLDERMVRLVARDLDALARVQDAIRDFPVEVRTAENEPARQRDRGAPAPPLTSERRDRSHRAAPEDRRRGRGLRAAARGPLACSPPPHAEESRGHRKLASEYGGKLRTARRVLAMHSRLPVRAYLADGLVDRDLAAVNAPTGAVVPVFGRSADDVEAGERFRAATRHAHAARTIVEVFRPRLCLSRARGAGYRIDHPA
jgi:uncharacterized membrane protein YhiD involved in acid resistance